MLKRILIIILGIIVGSVFIYLVEALGHLVYPPPEGIDTNDMESMKIMIDQLPFGAFLFVLLAYGVGSFIGGLLSAFLSKNGRVANAVIVGSILMIFGIINLLMIPHPVWFTLVSIMLFIPCAYLAGQLVIKYKAN